MWGFKWWRDEALRTLVMVNLAAIMERADEALLPGVYREIGLALHASPAKLGSLTLVRSLMQALCAPLAAYAAVNHNRAQVIALGAVLWAIATFFVGISATFAQVRHPIALFIHIYMSPLKSDPAEFIGPGFKHNHSV
jgi:predicted MFS family arabinose efflux permease